MNPTQFRSAAARTSCALRTRPPYALTAVGQACLRRSGPLSNGSRHLQRSTSPLSFEHVLSLEMFVQLLSVCQTANCSRSVPPSRYKSRFKWRIICLTLGSSSKAQSVPIGNMQALRDFRALICRVSTKRINQKDRTGGDKYCADVFS